MTDTVPKPASEIIKRVWSPSDEDRELIADAYEFAQSAHADDKRLSGRPYFHHVVETARVLADLRMEASVIAAGLLHDTIDDTNVSPEAVKQAFGKEILFLTQGVSKLGDVRYQGMRRHIESLRKLFVATSQDIRTLIIKLADRQHNLETLEHIPDKKQTRIAEETLEVYVPIAHRLGIGKLKTDLEDLAFPYVYPDEYEKTKKISQGSYEQAIETIEKMRKKLSQLLSVDDAITDFSIDYRQKGLYSLYKKLEKKDMNIDEIYDIAALRVIVDSTEDCYQVLGLVNSQWQPLAGRLKDYIANPKPNGYQSLHTTVFTGDGSIAEVQIRTKDMHEIAEYGAASHAEYKNKDSGRLQWFDDIADKLQKETQSQQSGNVPQWINDFNEIDEAADNPAEFIDTVQSDLFEDRIFVFSPKGDVIDLPRGASPLDFAYQIHTEVGHHAAGVKVNNKMAALDTKLDNGDIVKIITDDNQSPSRKWLEYAKTAEARRKIKAHVYNS
jgi:GTP pyrophosphokinase